MTSILRKRALIARTLAETANKKDDLRDLYVFGYQCKLFRDDERALFIDRGKHLIPWMGNENLMIDRYDGRGHLHDLSKFDCELVQATTLSEEERHIEALCDEERYLELNSDILEKMLYEEEELKRLNEALADDSYSAVGFDYNGSDKTTEESSTTETSHVAEDDEDARPYVPIAALQLPAHLSLPKTEKIHAIIERTAAFIAEHGVQMEIMMKAKQKDNTQFSFLNYEDELNAYYKHVLHAIKHAKYTPASAAQKAAADAAEEAYLHPNLSSSSEKRLQSQPQHISSKEFLESISAKLPVGQIANTPYAKLLSNLSKHTRTQSPKPVESVDRSATAVNDKSLPVVRSAPSLQQVASYSTSDSSKTVTHNNKLPPVPGLEPVALPPVPSLEPVALPLVPGLEPVPVPSLEPVALPSSSQSTSAESSSVDNNDTSVIEEVSEPRIVPPPPDAKLIIDKMADYVARNGPEFEIVVRRRNDDRFRFVDADHPHHAYYLHKKNAFLHEMEKKKMSEAVQDDVQESTENVQQQPATAETKESVDDNNDKAQSRAVSFIIKTKEEEAPVLKKATALQYETSDEDDDDDDADVDDDESDVSTQQSAARPATYPASSVNGIPLPPPSTAAVSTTTISRSGSIVVASSADTKKLPPVTDSRKHADRLADKLAAAARDKMSSVSRDRHLQEQRKQKAAAFLTRMKQSDTGQTADDAAAECASNPGSIVLTPSMSPISVLSVQSRSRSVTPQVSAPVASSAAGSTLELPADNSSLVSSRKLLSKRHKHRSRSPRHRRHRSRSHSHHRSSSKKHHKRKKKLPSAYAEMRPASKSPRRKASARSPSHKSKQLHDSSNRHKSSGAAGASDNKLHSSKKRHASSKDSKRHHRSKKHRKTKQSYYRSSSSSSYTSSASETPVKRRRLPADNLIDLTLGDKPDQSSSHDDADQLSPSASQHSLQQEPSSSNLSEVQALIEEKRRQLLKEDIVVLD